MSTNKWKSVKIAGLVIFLIFTLPLHAREAEGFLSKDQLERIQSAVYEVVIKKPVNDSFTYEKELPMHLLPFAVRNDKYISIGSAFKIGKNFFVSAAHVMLLGEGSQYREVYLRDTDKNIFTIGKILKYSNQKDFVVFSVENDKTGPSLGVNHKSEINTKVYAVGNAHGEGVIIRDGLLTSLTPEEDNGEWKWLRFSAAASPGNSGGPLLDSRGRVIGIVLRKSENENLNYALPVLEVFKTEEKMAEYHMNIAYSLDNITRVNHEVFHREVTLPMAYNELNVILEKGIQIFIESLVEKTRKKYSSELFPKGEKSYPLLYSNYSADFPNLIAESKTGYWDSFKPAKIKSEMLRDNGFIKYGNINNYLLLYLHKPDDISLKTFYADSKIYMDTILQGIPFTRNIGSDSVRINSLGKAVEEYTYKDSYGRKWMVKVWNIEYSDTKILSYSLPVPGGVIAMVRSGSSGKVDFSYRADTKYMSDFVHLSYYGSFSEWDEFLGLKDYLPDSFDSIQFHYTKNGDAKFVNDRFVSSYNTDVMKIDEDSDMRIVFNYFPDKDGIAWDVVGLVWGENKRNKTSVSLFRNIKPHSSLNEGFQNNWYKIENHQFPFNKSPFFSNGDTIIRSVYTESERSNKDVLYTLGYSTEGKVDDSRVLHLIDKVSESIHLKE